MSNNIAIVAGGTGLVGQYVLEYLLEDDDFEKVYILNRRSVGYIHHKAKEIIVDFENLSDSVNDIRPTHAYCCLGTTIKKAGSKEAFKKVDYYYALEFAEVVHRLGCENFSVVTALGTNHPSSIFYNQVKYELTQSLIRERFQILNIIQPSLLIGDRGEIRIGEKIGQKVFEWTNSLWIGPFKKYAGIEGRQVAKAMVAISKKQQHGIFKYPSDQLQKF
ncbi:MAG: NAD-dependent epimerase/dehydratase family protein [Chitinophagales bacterium]|nr:NAD-dependent epimerase/dehydratase family protein [Chitinophagales bacterium]MCZ2392766.1 NAD-dependent epimerase/dehydratase family protein [Chitinophagales bacterium]